MEILSTTTHKSPFLTRYVFHPLPQDQDHYTLLGISSRWKATQDDIKKAYRKAVLKHHPDKKSPEELGSEDDQAKARAFFTCIQQAYDVLSDPAKRLLFDSVDPFDKSINDDVPGPVRDAAAFYKVFGPAFERNARLVRCCFCMRCVVQEPPF